MNPVHKHRCVHCDIETKCTLDNCEYYLIVCEECHSKGALPINYVKMGSK